MAQLKDLIVNGPSRFIGPAYGLIKAFSANGSTISIMIGGESATTTITTTDSSPSLTIANSGQTNNGPQPAVYGAVTGGTKGHAITLQRTNKVYSASTADSARTVISTFKVSSAATATNLQHPLHIYQNGTRVATYSGGTIVSALTTDSQVTAVGNHYTATTATKTGGTTTASAASAIKGITYDAAGHIVGITTGSVLTSASDTATTESGHYSPTGKTNSVGVTTSGSFIKQVFYDSKGHVTSATTGTALTSQASVTAGTVGDGVVTGITASGTSNHAIVGLKTTAVKVNSASTASSASVATNLAQALHIYKNGTRIATYSGGTIISALTTDTDTKVTAVGNHYTASTATKTGGTTTGTDASAIKGITYDAAGHIVGITTGSVLTSQNSVTAGTVGTGVVTGITASGTSNHAIVGIKTTAVKVDSASTATNLAQALHIYKNGTRIATYSGGTTISALTTDTDTKVTAVGNHYTATTATKTGGTTTGTDASAVKGITYDAAGHIVSITTGSVLTSAADTATTYAGHYTPSSDSTGTTSGARITGITKDGKGHIISIATAATDNTDTATTYAGHYTPSNNATASTTGARITGITRDGKGHIISISTAATDNTDTATTETGHYSPTGKTNSVGVATAGSFLKQVFYDSKGHVTSATTGTALTSQASVTAGTVGTGVVTGITASGTSNHAIVGIKSEAVKVNSASTAYGLGNKLVIYQNNSLLATYDGTAIVSAKTTDTNTALSVSTAGTAGAAITGITTGGTVGHTLTASKGAVNKLVIYENGTAVGTYDTTGIVSAKTNDEKVKNVTGTTKAYILGQTATSITDTAQTHAKAYITSGKIYSNDSEVMNLDDAQTVNGVKSFIGTLAISNLATANDGYRQVPVGLVSDTSNLVRYMQSAITFNPYNGNVNLTGLTRDRGGHTITVPQNKSGVIALVDDIEANTEDLEFVFATAVNDLNANKQDKLVSGDNIKTINGQSLLGSGDLTIQGGGGGAGGDDTKVLANWQNGVTANILAQTRSLSGTAAEAIIVPGAYFGTAGTMYYGGSEVMNLAKAQTVTGVKTFSNGYNLTVFSSPTDTFRNVPVAQDASVTCATIRYITSGVAINPKRCIIQTSGLTMNRGTNVVLMPENKSGTIALLSDITTAEDTKVTNTASSAKAYILGQSTQGSNGGALSNENCYISGGYVYSNAKKASNLVVCSLTQSDYDSLSSYDQDTLFAISGSVQSMAMTTGTTSMAATVTLNTSAARTYHICTGTTTSITLAGTIQNPGYDHYILFKNTRTSGNMTIVPKTGWISTNSAFVVPPGGYVELSYICAGGLLIITGSKSMTAV